MADQTLLAKSRNARLDDLPNFSGHPSEDVERFLRTIKSITKATDESENHEILEIVRGKLVQSAGIWFDNNETDFRKWSDFEMQFRNRYFSTTLIQKKFDKLKQRKQSSGESILSYVDDVITICREMDSRISDLVIIQYLMSGLQPDLRKELSRRQSTITTLAEFIKYAKIEQDIHDTFEKSLESYQVQYNRSIFPPLTATVERPNKQHHLTIKDDRHPRSFNTRSSVVQRNSNHQMRNKTTINQPTPSQHFYKCKVCGRQNHRTIDCFYKQTSGCFNCGKSHLVRDCPTPPNFQ